MIFNEDKLQEEIIKTWGEFGAHNEVFKMMRLNLVKNSTKVCNSCHKESDTGHQIFICEDCGVKPEIVITDKI